jgi:hypothetical protein
MVRLEVLGALKEMNDPIGSRTRDLPACSIAPQPSMLRTVALRFHHDPPFIPLHYT